MIYVRFIALKSAKWWIVEYLHPGLEEILPETDSQNPRIVTRNIQKMVSNQSLQIQRQPGLRVGIVHLCLFRVRLNFEKLYPGSRSVSRELNWTLCCLHFGCSGDSYAPPVHLLISHDLRGGKATSHSPLSGAEGNRREPKPGGGSRFDRPICSHPPARLDQNVNIRY